MKKNKKTIIGALLLIVVMTFSMVTSVFADDTVTDVTMVGKDGSVSITSKFVFAEGLKIPNGDDGVTFNYEVIPTNGGPTASIAPVTFFDTTDRIPANLKDGLYTVSKTSDIEFGTFSHAGFYSYTVSRKSDEVPNVEPCGSIYYLNVWVENDGNGGLTIKNMTAKKEGEGDKKVGELTFTHTYKKMGKLTITKHTVSPEGTPDVADKTKTFNFNINFNVSPTAKDVETVKGKLNGVEQDFVVGINSTTFQMKDGDILVFDELPVGMKFMVSESGTAGYTPSIKVVSNGSEATYNTFNKGERAEFAYALVGEGENSAEFTNTYEPITVTGIIMNNLPFIMLIGIAVLALSVLVISKKRRTAGR